MLNTEHTQNQRLFRPRNQKQHAHTKARKKPGSASASAKHHTGRDENAESWLNVNQGGRLKPQSGCKVADSAHKIAEPGYNVPG